MYQKGSIRALICHLSLTLRKLSLEESDKLFWKFQTEHTPFFMDRIKEWGMDMIAVRKEMKERFSKYIDLSCGIGAGGHSFGGATAYYLCQNDDEICCGINMDGAIFGDYRNKIMKKPFLQFSCKQHWNLESMVLLRKESPVYTFLFEKMKHLGFTDLKFLSNSKALVGELDCGILYSYLLGGHLAFLDKYLKGRDVKMMQSEHQEISIEVC